jgi:ADP-glucose pyrophosphorylase
MKVIILAGGLGTRLAEETKVRPKPMVEIDWLIYLVDTDLKSATGGRIGRLRDLNFLFIRSLYGDGSCCP